MNILNEIVVVKRSGQRTSFNGSKIAVAIKQAYDDVSNNYDLKETNKVYEEVLKYIIENYKTRKTINVEDIQDIIENVLKNINENVYNAFVKYRTKRAESRKVFSLKQQHKFVKAIENFDTLSNLLTPNDTLIKYGEIISKEYIKSYILDNKYTRLHEEGRIYIDNLAYFNLGYLNDTHIKVENILNVNLIKNLIDIKTEINGEISIDEIDVRINKYEINNFKKILKNKVYKYLKIVGILDYINIKKIYDKINKIESIDIEIDIFKEFILNDQVKNILIYSLIDSKEEYIKNINQIIQNLLVTLNNNISLNKKYSISVSENDNYIKNIIVDKIKNLPFLDNITLNFKIGNNYDIDSIYQLLDKNVKFVFDNNNYFSNGLLINESYGKSNIASTSINISRLGIKYKKINNDFYKELDELIDITKNQLLFVFETIGDKVKENYQLLFKGNILDDEKLESNQKIRKVIKNGTLNINLVGLIECSNIISPNNPFDIIKKLTNYIKNKIDSINKEVKLNFTLSIINNKGCNELIILDKAIYGIIDKVTKESSYKNIFEIDDIDDIKKIIEIKNNLTGGFLIKYETKNLSIKKLREIIDESIKYKIGILELRCKK